MWLIDLRVVDGDSRTNSYAETAHCSYHCTLVFVHKLSPSLNKACDFIVCSALCHVKKRA
ncbi:hypothetical protein T4E_6182 [Trichinella pseudospiralis]|uniref:Uncharacterized protein n=1 Tax=Trichinella pseudospiralis TaxID=6337 RepID=A0A0V0XDY9_TRIPS|nr:hypothetical protein T4E_6182 [Trichinella pseudospiralis]